MSHVIHQNKTATGTAEFLFMVWLSHIKYLSTWGKKIVIQKSVLSSFLHPLTAEHLANVARQTWDPYKTGCSKQKLQLNVQLPAYASCAVCKTSFCMHVCPAQARSSHPRACSLSGRACARWARGVGLQAPRGKGPRPQHQGRQDKSPYVKHPAPVQTASHLTGGRKWLIKAAWKIKGMVNNRVQDT